MNDLSQQESIEPHLCKCGKPADTFIAGKECLIWRCNVCLYGENYNVSIRMGMKAEYGTIQKAHFPGTIDDSWTIKIET